MRHVVNTFGDILETCNLHDWLPSLLHVRTIGVPHSHSNLLVLLFPLWLCQPRLKHCETQSIWYLTTRQQRQSGASNVRGGREGH